MKDLKEALINKNNIKSASARKNNKFGITKKDLISDLEGFTLGIVVRMLEETELQENVPNIKVFQKDSSVDVEEGGFNWDHTEDGFRFWSNILNNRIFDEFYKRYPEYKKYDKQ